MVEAREQRSPSFTNSGIFSR
ncbi:hypothetical protein OIU79_019797 [Salix purpurea]|uniref:Uncharacterized protein n=1 Tax=Salix purpurea TaxID=77065 RepID=A0A9Q0P231_SALPP|nr:hypothetical protein OIU79_019797 [Salix purpurea]